MLLEKTDVAILDVDNSILYNTPDSHLIVPKSFGEFQVCIDELQSGNVS